MGMYELLFKKKESPQYEIRVALSRLLGMKGMNIPVMAEAIGLDRYTLTKFLKDEKDLSFITLIKIVDYIEAQNEIMNNGIKK